MHSRYDIFYCVLNIKIIELKYVLDTIDTLADFVPKVGDAKLCCQQGPMQPHHPSAAGEEPREKMMTEQCGIDL